MQLSHDNQANRYSEGMMEKYLVSTDIKGSALLDEASIIRAACRDPAAFNQLYLAHVRPIYRYIFSKVGEVRQTEDLTAQVFLEALESLPRYRHDGHFAAWLFGIARNKVADHYRTQHTELPLFTHVETPPRVDPLSSLIQNEDMQRVSKIILQLGEQDRELLQLRIVAELTFEEIAKLIHSNMEATKKRFYRLLATMRQQLELDHD